MYKTFKNIFWKLGVFTLGLLIIFFSIQVKTAADKRADDFRKIKNNAFKVGEKLTFDVKYGFVTAGIASFNIPQIRKISGRDAFHITFEVNTVPSFDWIYKVRDRYETFVDVEGIFPWRFEQHIREGSFSRDFSAYFDQRKGKAQTTEGQYVIPPYVNDIVSAFYLARTFDYSNLKPDETFHLQNFYKNKTYDLDVKFLGRETVNVSAGTFKCIIVEPLVQEGGLFKSEGSIIIWLTDDDLKIPVKVKTKVVVGSIDAELTKYEGLAGKLMSKK
ncbi:MAG TPA: DUF3108 domain-containing protein [Ignavibacteriaceae bacterium]|nr:DUF3108 domain-containing protein [Ignavibacteriaceae bacterium]